MQRQGDGIGKVGIGIGEVGNIKAHILIGRVHGQGLIVHIGSNAALCHLDNDVISLLSGNAGNAGNVQMTGGLMYIRVMGHGFHTQRTQRGIEHADDLLAALQHAGIALHLHQAQSSCHVGHITLVPGANNVILPSTQLGLCQGILGLTMEAQQLQLLIDGFIFNTFQGAPCQSAAFRGGKVLHRMEREGGEVCQATGRLTLTGSTEGMGGICHNGYATQRGLDLSARNKQVLLAFHDFIQPVIVTGNTCQIHRDDGLGIGSNCCLHLVIVHLKGILLGINQNDLCAYMVNDGSRRSVGIRRSDDLIAGAYAQNTQSHLRTGGLGVQTHCLLRAAIGSYLTFQFLGSGAGGNPAGTQCVAYFINFRFRNIGRAKRNFHHNKHLTLLVFYLYQPGIRNGLPNIHRSAAFT